MWEKGERENTDCIWFIVFSAVDKTQHEFPHCSEKKKKKQVPRKTKAAGTACFELSDLFSMVKRETIDALQLKISLW